MTAPTPQITAIRLGDIKLDPRAWPRDQLDSGRVELFAEMIRDARDSAGHGQGWTDPLPSLVVVADGKGGYVLADGRHRYEARRRLGAGFDLVQVQLHLLNGLAPADCAYLLALHFATVSAKPLSTIEKGAAVDRLLAEHPELSNRQIARLVGVSHTMVNDHRARVEGSSGRGDGSSARIVESDCEGDSPAATASSRSEPLHREVAARQLAEDVAELLDSCRKLFGGADFKSAGRELYDALADMYGDDDALEVIDELNTVVGNARAHAKKVAQVE